MEQSVFDETMLKRLQGYLVLLRTILTHLLPHIGLDFFSSNVSMKYIEIHNEHYLAFFLLISKEQCGGGTMILEIKHPEDASDFVFLDHFYMLFYVVRKTPRS